jgi:predicted O-methyltransferase YrrM
MNEYLERILDSGTVEAEDGEKLPLEANTSRGQCEFLQRIAREIKAERSLEIGLAHGVSAIALAEVTGDITTIDPYQFAAWRNIGLLNLKRAGFASRHFEEASQDVLPRLTGERFDIAYIDTTKIFDMVLVDCFYVTRLLRVGGVVVVDDCNWPGVRKVVRYLARMPHLKVYATYGRESSSAMRKIGSIVARLPASPKIFRSELIDTDESLGIAAGCVAFVKMGEDTRQWDWSITP